MAVDPANLATQRKHEFGRAYEAVQTASERLELCGLDHAAAMLRSIRREVYQTLVALDSPLAASTALDPSGPRGKPRRGTALARRRRTTHA